MSELATLKGSTNEVDDGQESAVLTRNKFSGTCSLPTVEISVPCGWKST
jgi:hypothetical protein